MNYHHFVVPLVFLFIASGRSTKINTKDIVISTWPDNLNVILKNVTSECIVDLQFDSVLLLDDQEANGNEEVNMHVNFDAADVEQPQLDIYLSGCTDSQNYIDGRFEELTLLQLRCLKPEVFLNSVQRTILTPICKNVTLAENSGTPVICSRTCDWLYDLCKFNCTGTSLAVESCNYKQFYQQVSASEILFADWNSRVPLEEDMSDCLNWTDPRIRKLRRKKLLPLVENNYCYPLESSRDYWCFSEKQQNLRKCSAGRNALVSEVNLS